MGKFWYNKKNEIKDSEYFYHVTALENLESILNGGLQSRDSLGSRSFHDSANQEIIGKRGCLDNYVPLHFTQYTPCGKSIQKGLNEEWVCLVFKREVIDKNYSTNYTNLHPLNSDVVVCENLVDIIPLIEWNIMHQSVDDVQDNELYKNVMHSECQVLGKIDACDIHAIVTPKINCDLDKKSQINCEIVYI